MDLSKTPQKEELFRFAKTNGISLWKITKAFGLSFDDSNCMSFREAHELFQSANDEEVKISLFLCLVKQMEKIEQIGKVFDLWNSAPFDDQEIWDMFLEKASSVISRELSHLTVVSEVTEMALSFEFANETSTLEVFKELFAVRYAELSRTVQDLREGINMFSSHKRLFLQLWPKLSVRQSELKELYTMYPEYDLENYIQTWITLATKEVEQFSDNYSSASQLLEIKENLPEELSKVKHLIDHLLTEIFIFKLNAVSSIEDAREIFSSAPDGSDIQLLAIHAMYKKWKQTNEVCSC